MLYFYRLFLELVKNGDYDVAPHTRTPSSSMYSPVDPVSSRISSLFFWDETEPSALNLIVLTFELGVLISTLMLAVPGSLLAPFEGILSLPASGGIK